MPKRTRGRSRSRLQDHRLVRLDEAWPGLPNRWGIPVEVCAGAEVPIEPAAVDELGSVLQTAATFERLARDVPGFLGREGEARLSRVALMPDVHKGAGIPIGTVLETVGVLLPQAVGSDVNCGMRLEATTLPVDRLRPPLDALATRLRHLCFAGGRQLPMTALQREALLREGLPGLLDAVGGDGRSGLWRRLQPARSEEHTSELQSLRK